MASITVKKDAHGEVVSYRVRACIARDASGRQVWRTITLAKPDGNLTPKKELREIERLAADWEAEQREQYEKTNAKEDRSKVSIQRFINEYWLPLDVRDGKHKPSTVAFYEREAADITAYFGTKPISKIGVSDLKQYITHLRTNARRKDGTPYSASSIVHYYKTLSMILESARRMRFISSNPCNDLRASEKPHDDPNKKIDFLRPEEAQRFVDCLNTAPLFWRAFFTTLILTGIRRGEACGLQWQDLNDEARTLTISRSVARDSDAEGKQIVSSTKNGKSRVVPVVNELYDLLMAWKAEQTERYGELMPTAFIFGRDTDPYTPLYATSPTRWLARFEARNGLPDASPHDLRHSFATLSLRSGADLVTISKNLGHSDIKVTVKNYAEVMLETQREAAEGMAKLILKRKEA